MTDSDTFDVDSSAHSSADESTKKGGLWKKHKVELIAAAVGIGVTYYLYKKSQANSTAANTTTAGSASPTGAYTPSYTGGGSGGGGSWTGPAGSSGQHTAGNNPASTDPVVAAVDANTQAMLDALSTGLGTTPQVNVIMPPSTSSPNAQPTVSAPSAQPLATNQTPAQAKAAVRAGTETPRAALKSEVSAAHETPAQRHSQEVANRGLRAKLHPPTKK